MPIVSRFGEALGMSVDGKRSRGIENFLSQTTPSPFFTVFQRLSLLLVGGRKQTLGSELLALFTPSPPSFELSSSFGFLFSHGLSF